MRLNIRQVIIHFTVSKTEGKISLDSCWGSERGLYPRVCGLSLSSREGHFFLRDYVVENCVFH